MSEHTFDINEIGATAFVIASIRAMESEKTEPLFHDPYSGWFSNEWAQEAARKMDAAFPPATTMIRFRTCYFDHIVEHGIANGIRQFVLLGGGFDIRAHRFRDSSVNFFEVDQKAVLDYKCSIFERNGFSRQPSVPGNYLEIDVPAELASLGLKLDAPTSILWEGNTMYLLPESIIRFLNRLESRMPAFQIAFDYFAMDLQNRELNSGEDLKRIEGVENALGVSFTAGFPDLSVFEEETPLQIVESNSVVDLAEKYGQGHAVATYPEDWQKTLSLYRYCVLKRN